MACEKQEITDARRPALEGPNKKQSMVHLCADRGEPIQLYEMGRVGQSRLTYCIDPALYERGDGGADGGTLGEVVAHPQGKH